MELGPGTVISERYELAHELGTGGMGSVWAARHLVTGKDVALKFLGAQGASKPDARRRFIREARAASRVRHPNVVAVHDVLELDDGGLVMVMDRLYGESLGDRLDRLKTLPLAETATIMAPVVSAVGSAHAVGVVHRDLKPDNIFLTDAAPQVRVLDFGIAKLIEDSDAAGLTNTGAMLGTPYYMSPEQIFGEKDIDARTDVWSVGVILYECLSGRRPFEGDNAGQVMKAILKGHATPIGELVPDLPDAIAELIDKMMEIDRENRPRDLREPLRILSDFGDVPFSGPTLSVPPRSRPPSLDSDPYAITTEDSLRTFDTGTARSRPRPIILDTAGGVSTATHHERRGSYWIVAGAIATVAVLAFGGWMLLHKPSSEPASEAAAPPPVTEPTKVSESAPVKPAAVVPESSASAAPHKQGHRLARPSASTKSPPAPAASSTALPHGISDEVPF